MIKVEVWFDFLSKSSFETIKKLHEVLDELNDKNINVYYRSYLDYLVPEDDKNNMLYQKNNGAFLETTYAHELFHYAKLFKKERNVIIDVFESLYIQKKDIDLKNVLDEIVIKNNLSLDKWNECFEKHTFVENIVSNVYHAKLKKINCIPHIRVNVNNKLKGCQSKEDILTAIIRAKESLFEKDYCQGSDCHLEKQKHLI